MQKTELNVVFIPFLGGLTASKPDVPWNPTRIANEPLACGTNTFGGRLVALIEDQLRAVSVRTIAACLS